MLITEIVILLLIFLIVITQRIGIRITKDKVTTVYVNFIFTAIRVGNGKRHKAKISKIFKNRFFIKSALEYLLPKTDIKIFSLESDSDRSLTSQIFDNILLGTMLTYVKNSARSVVYLKDSKCPLDIELSFVLYYGIISLILGQYYKTKNQLLRN